MRKLSVEELNRLTTEEFKSAVKTPLVIVLDNIRSQNNIGSVFRTCDAFLVERLYLCGITAVPPHKEIHKTALGATESVDWEYSDGTLLVVKNLKKAGYIVLAAEQADRSILLDDYVVDAGKKYAIVLGHEMRGVEQAVIDECNACIEIPQYGTKHSLNVAVSAGILIWHFFRKLKKLNSY
jgi:23S rRNA (guanosine2251-2'-O)-methyltransferase